MFLEFVADGDEWLDVASASDYLDDNVELEFVGWEI